MNWLTRIQISAKAAYEAKIVDSYAWHKKLWECFPDMPDAKRDFLTRVDVMEGSYQAWILSKKEPVRPAWCPPEGFAVKQISPEFLNNKKFAFDIHVNPVKSEPRRSETGELLRGKRKTITSYDELQNWLVSKGKIGGFKVNPGKLEIVPMSENYFTRRGRSGFHKNIRFRGIMEITDQERFIETYQSGIGAGKGFHFGMLLLAPVR